MMPDRAIMFNKMSLIDKIKDYIERNVSDEIIESSPTYLKFHYQGNFSTTLIRRIFAYWGIKNWKDWVDHFSFEPYSIRRIIVTVVLNKNPDYSTCEHSYQKVMGWGNLICEKCGFFKPSEVK